MKVSSIIKKEVCGINEEFLLLSEDKGKNFFNGISMKNLFTNHNVLDINEKEIKTEFDGINLSVFHNEFEKEKNTELMVERLIKLKNEIELRYKDWRFVRAGIMPVSINTEKVNVDYHFAIVNDKFKKALIFKAKNAKCKLTPRGRTPKTNISKNKELFLLSQVGEVLFPGYETSGAIAFLNELNIVIREFSGDEVLDLKNDITDIIKSKGRVKCSKSECSSCSYDNLCNLKLESLTELKKVTPVGGSKGKVSFTKSQEKFINADKGVYRVLAGAGAGKTTVIANNVIKLLKEGVSPKKILLITFSTKGVEELKEKIQYWIITEKIKVDINDLMIFTFNGYGQYLIEEDFDKLGYTKKPRIIDKIEKFSILNEIISKKDLITEFNYNNPFMNLKYSKGVCIQVSDILNDIKKGDLTPFEIVEDYKVCEESAKILMEIYLEYNAKIKSLNLIEFEDQINLAYELLQDEDILNKHGMYHIICDEFQDSDLMQIHLIRRLYDYKYSMSLCVCGDDSQSIFSWRGANQANIVEFEKMFANVQDIKMVQNFRSTSEICDMANTLNSYLTNKVDKKLVSKMSGVSPSFIESGLYDIAKRIKVDVDGGMDLSKIAVISRTKSQLAEVKEELNSFNLPCYTAVSETISSNKKVQNIIKWFNFLEDYTLDLNFLHYLQLVDNKNFELNKATGTIKKYVEGEKNKFLGVYEPLSEIDRIQFILEEIKKLQDTDDSIKALYLYLSKYKYNFVSEIVNKGKDIITYDADIFSTTENNLYEAITLITAHSSKGKEWDKVYVDLDSFKYNKDEEIIRLLFVAITRAKKELVVHGRKHSDLGEMLRGVYRAV